MALSTTLTSGGETTTEVSTIYTIKQGDAIYIPVTVTLDEETVTSEDVALIDELEFMIGKCIRRVAKASECWSDEAEAFLFELRQADTLLRRPGIYPFDCRIKLASGEVIGMNNTEKIRIADSMSREVI